MVVSIGGRAGLNFCCREMMIGEGGKARLGFVGGKFAVFGGNRGGCRA